MNKLITLLLILLLSGCSSVIRFNQLDPPIVVVAKSTDGNITIVSKSDKYITIPYAYYLGKTLSESYIKGDTIIYIK